MSFKDDEEKTVSNEVSSLDRTESESAYQQKRTAAASGQELDIMNLLQQLGISAGGQMGDMSNIASGNIFGSLSKEEENALRESIAATTSQSMRASNQSYTGEMAALRNQLGSTGRSDSSMERIEGALLSGRKMDREADIMDTAARQYYEGRMALPFQNAQAQIMGNKQLFDQLSGSLNPVMQNLSATRFGNQGIGTSGISSLMQRGETSGESTKTTSGGFNLIDLVSAGFSLADMIKGMGTGGIGSQDITTDYGTGSDINGNYYA